jgi:hypothetical protein
MVTLAARLRDACVGHTVASIPWPHRLLHDAADEIERLDSALEQAQSCILGDTPEDMTPEDARQDTLAKLRAALNAP